MSILNNDSYFLLNILIKIVKHFQECCIIIIFLPSSKSLILSISKSDLLSLHYKENSSENCPLGTLHNVRDLVCILITIQFSPFQALNKFVYLTIFIAPTMFEGGVLGTHRYISNQNRDSFSQGISADSIKGSLASFLTSTISVIQIGCTDTIQRRQQWYKIKTQNSFES